MARSAADYGVELSGEISYNLQKIRERRTRSSYPDQGHPALFKSWGVDLIPGRGSLISEEVVRSVQKDVRRRTSGRPHHHRHRFTPRRYPGLPFDGNNILSSNDAVLMQEVPSRHPDHRRRRYRCEFAFLYRSLGSSVTVVEMLPRALSPRTRTSPRLLKKSSRKRDQADHRERGSKA